MKYYPRKIIPEILEWIGKTPIIVIIGGRQVGKTVLLQLLIDKLKSSGVEQHQTFYMDLEDFRNLEICNRGLDFFKRFLNLQGINLSKRSYIFIDEIQYLDNPTNFLKLIADHERNIQLIVSGSSTLDIRKKFKDTLTGRKRVFHLQPLDFEEYLVFKEEENLLNWYKRNCFASKNRVFDPTDFYIVKQKLQELADDFIIFGGYPAVVKEKEEKIKIGLLQEIIQTYIRKDIKDFTHIENVVTFNRLMVLLAARVGNLLNLNELCKEVRITRLTLIIKLLNPFFTNIKLEVVKMPKLYFLDTEFQFS